MFRFLKPVRTGGARARLQNSSAQRRKQRTLLLEVLDKRELLAADLANLDLLAGSESGASLVDNITNVNRPNFTVDFTNLTFPQDTLQLRDGGPTGKLVGQLVITSPALSDEATTTSTISSRYALADGVHEIQAMTGSGVGERTSLSITIDTVAPEFSEFSGVVTTTDEDTAVEISFSDLIEQGDETDVTTSVDAFLVQAVSSGTLLIGSSSETALPFSAETNNVIDETHHAFWSPDSNANGELSAFTVLARDLAGNISESAVTATVDVLQVNDVGTFGGDKSGSGDEDDGPITGTLTFADESDGASAPNFMVTTDSMVTTDHVLSRFTQMKVIVEPSGGGVATIDPETGEWSYAPNLNFNGSDSFTVAVTDDDGNTETQVIQIIVNQINDPGTFGGNSDRGDEDSTLGGTVTFVDLADGDTAPNFQITIAPMHGEASIDAETGVWSFIPDANFHGTDSFTISATDNDANTELSVVSLVVSQVNDPGTFAGDFSGEDEEDTESITGSLSFSDKIDGASVPDFMVTTAATNGKASIDKVTGDWVYTPNLNFNGNDSFTVTATDDDGNEETQIISVTLTQVDDLGKFSGFEEEGEEDSTISGTLTFVDLADGSTTPNFTITTLAEHGEATIDAATGLWSYDPAENFNGTDMFTVVVTDDDGNTQSQDISVTVTQVNDVGTFGGDTSGSASEDSEAITGTLTFTDVADGFTTPNFKVTTWATGGKTYINSKTGAWSYLAAPNFNGEDSFTVSVKDDDGNVETKVITIVISQVNDPGIYSGDKSGVGPEDTAITGTLMFTDKADGATAPNFMVTSAAANGTASIDATTGGWNYTPGKDFNGEDQFTVTVTDDDGNLETQVVSVTVTSVNDPPIFTIGANQTVNEDSGAQTVTLWATGIAPGPANESEQTVEFSVTGNSNPGLFASAPTISSKGTLKYTPLANAFGVATITVQLIDNGGSNTTSEPQTFTITVNGVNDRPVNALQNSSAETIDEDTSLVFSEANGNQISTSDIDAETLQISLKVSHGTLSLATLEGLEFTTGDGTSDSSLVFVGSISAVNAAINGLRYLPNDSYSGSDTLIIRTNDQGQTGSGGDKFDLDSININVVNVDNDAPTAANLSLQITEDSTINSSLLATDKEAQPLTYRLSKLKNAHGTVNITPATGQFTFIPDANFFGTATFAFVANDGTSDSNEAVVTIEVSAVNDVPVAFSNSYTTNQDAIVEGNAITTDTGAGIDKDVETAIGSLLISEVNGSAMDIGSEITLPSGATLTLHADGTFSYDASTSSTITALALGQTASDSFTYRIVDEADATSNLGTVSFTVNAVNDPPKLEWIGKKEVNELTTLTFNASASDPDLPADTLTFSLGEDAPAGAEITSSGAFSWTPTEAQGPGKYSFDIIVSDGSLTDSQTISVTVKDVNVGPTLNTIGGKVVNELSTLTFTATATDADLPTNALTFSLSGTIPSGASITSAGVFTWTPTEAQGGSSYTFDVLVSDGTATDSKKVTIEVREVNTSPILAEIGGKSVAELSSLTFTATATDSDLPANTLQFSLGGTAPTGASITSAGVFTWTPTEAQGSGEYTFEVIVSDGTATDSETITVSVSEVNASPVLAAIGNKSVSELETLTFTATATDADLPANTLQYSLSGTIPTGASITSAGVFTWTPTEAQGGRSYSFDVVVTDGSVTDTETISIAVSDINIVQQGVATSYIVGFNAATAQWYGSNLVTGTSKVLQQWSPSAGWRDWVTGDFNGDGSTDIAARTEQGQWWVGIADAAGFTTTSWAVWRDRSGATNNARVWDKVAVADVNDDGRDDIIAFSGEASNNQVIEPRNQWRVLVSSGTAFRPNKNFNWSTTENWVDVQVGDFTGDGRADLAGRVQANGDWWVGVAADSSGAVNFTTSQWANWAPRTWRNVRTADYNGDGKLDILGQAPSGQWWLAQSTGTRFINRAFAFWEGPNSFSKIVTGDVNGDGRDDLLGLSNNGSWFLTYSNGTTDVNNVINSSNATSLSIGNWAVADNYRNILVRDIDNDGISEILGRRGSTGVWRIDSLNTTTNALETQTNASKTPEWSLTADWIFAEVGIDDTDLFVDENIV